MTKHTFRPFCPCSASVFSAHASKHSNLLLFAYHLHFRCVAFEDPRTSISSADRHVERKTKKYGKIKIDVLCVCVCAMSHEPTLAHLATARRDCLSIIIIVFITVDHHSIYRYIGGRTLWTFGHHLSGDRSAIQIAP